MCRVSGVIYIYTVDDKGSGVSVFMCRVSGVVADARRSRIATWVFVDAGLGVSGSLNDKHQVRCRLSGFRCRVSWFGLVSGCRR